jgi:hypothetical protein
MLTINGTVPSDDGFDVNWPKNQFTLCQPQTQGRGPILEDPLCAGMGQTFSVGTFWPQGTTPIQFHFTRSRVAANGTVSEQQEFAQQTVTPSSNRTINASFTYAMGSTISVPSTGSEPAVAGSVSLTVAGAFVIAMALRRRRAASIDR